MHYGTYLHTILDTGRVRGARVNRPEASSTGGETRIDDGEVNGAYEKRIGCPGNPTLNLNVDKQIAYRFLTPVPC